MADQEEFRCTVCNYKTNNYRRIERHSELFHKNIVEEELHYCDSCDYVTNRIPHLNRHIAVVHKAAVAKIKTAISTIKHIKVESKSKENINPKVIIIKSLEFPAATQKIFKPSRRKRTNKGSGWSCEDCDFQGIRRYDLIRHAKIVHLKVLKVPCIYCDQKVDGWKELQLHNRTVHANLFTSYCDKCEYRGITKDDLRKHKKNCTR